jgi:hypothetical protein
MKTRTLALGALAASLGFAMPAQAALTMNLDTTAKTFSLTGTDTGAAISGIHGGFISWEASGVGAESGQHAYSTDLAFSTTLGTPGNTSNNHDTLLIGFPNGSFGVTLEISQSGATTLTGLNNFQSYAFLSSTNQAALESLIGTTMPIFQGTGFSGLSVAAVPVPAAVWLFGSALAGLIGFGRRKAG